MSPTRSTTSGLVELTIPIMSASQWFLTRRPTWRSEATATRRGASLGVPLRARSYSLTTGFRAFHRPAVTTAADRRRTPQKAARAARPPVRERGMTLTQWSASRRASTRTRRRRT